MSSIKVYSFTRLTIAKLAKYTTVVVLVRHGDE
jgi:hypothetical protein